MKAALARRKEQSETVAKEVKQVKFMMTKLAELQNILRRVNG
jgi:hypothetical protein